VRRVISLSVGIIIATAGVAYSSSMNRFDFYDSPSSGFLDPGPMSANIPSASLGFGRMPEGGFVPGAASLENPDSRAATEVRKALKFNERWLLDYGTGAHPRRRHAQQEHRTRSIWAMLGL
jgi:hypothetical protein